jgi:hypothetical protein
LWNTYLPSLFIWKWESEVGIGIARGGTMAAHANGKKEDGPFFS